MAAHRHVSTCQAGAISHESPNASDALECAGRRLAWTMCIDRKKIATDIAAALSRFRRAPDAIVALVGGCRCARVKLCDFGHLK